jgi:hypothetical protein
VRSRLGDGGVAVRAGPRHSWPRAGERRHTLGDAVPPVTGMAGRPQPPVPEPFRRPGRYDLTMYRVILIRVVLMTIAVVAVGVASFLIASIVLEWL